MTLRRVCFLLLTLAVSTLVGTGRAEGRTVAGEPAVELSVGAASSGQEVVVTGSGWPATTALTIMVCGNDDDEGTNACDVLGGQTLVTDPAGGFTTRLVVRVPPAPCPCTVRSSSAGTDTELSTPLAIVGAPYAAPSEDAPTTATTAAAADESSTAPTSESTGGRDWRMVVGAAAVLVVVVVWTRRVHHRRDRRAELPVAEQLAIGPSVPALLPTVPEAPEIPWGIRIPADRQEDVGVVPVTFTLPDALGAKSVVLCGDFNGWSRTATLLHRDRDTWTVTLPLEPGRSYRYQFLVDGRSWTTGTDGRLVTPNPFEPWFATVTAGSSTSDEAAKTARGPRS